MELYWQNKEAIENNDDKTLIDCLFHEGSLTRYLQDKCIGNFQIELKSESWQSPMYDEAVLLEMDKLEDAFIRESWLKSDNIKLVYARSVIPKNTFMDKANALTNLGTKPLGGILFADASTYRSEICYANIPDDCDLYKRVNNINNHEDIWGRRSLFYIQDKPLLISEIFMPEIKKCIQS